MAVRLIDRVHLSEQAGGDEGLARELLGLFRMQCETLVPGILDARSPRARRADLAHTLKGSALGIGAGPVALCAGRIETVLRGSGADPAEDCAELELAVAATLAEIT